MSESFNKNKAGEIRTDAMASMSDSAQASLAIVFSRTNIRGEVPTSQVDNATITIDADGGTSSELLITLVVNRVDETGTATTDTTVSINGAVFTTLQSIVNHINAQDGFTAWALHAPHDMDTGNDNFIDLATTELRSDGLPTEVLYRDIDQFLFDGDLVNYLRMGNPESRDSGSLKVIGIDGTMTGATNGVVNLYRDKTNGTKTLLRSFAAVNSTLTAYLNDKIDEASVYEGPLLLEIKTDDVTATNFRVRLQQVEL